MTFRKNIITRIRFILVQLGTPIFTIEDKNKNVSIVSILFNIHFSKNINLFEMVGYCNFLKQIT